MGRGKDAPVDTGHHARALCSDHCAERGLEGTVTKQRAAELSVPLRGLRAHAHAHGWPRALRWREGARGLLRLSVCRIGWSGQTPKWQTHVATRGVVPRAGLLLQRPLCLRSAQEPPVGSRRLACLHAGPGADLVQLRPIDANVSPPVKMEIYLKINNQKRHAEFQPKINQKRKTLGPASRETKPRQHRVL